MNRPTSTPPDDAERLLTLGLVGLGLAHELATPLATTALGLELLAERLHSETPPDTAEIGRELDLHLARVRRMGDLVQRFRGFARGTGGAPERVSLDQVVRTVIDLVRPALSELSQVQVVGGASDPEAVVFADRLLLEQAVSCLVLNGADATSTVPRSCQVRLDVGHDEADAFVSVIDDGPGFAALGEAPTVGHSSKPGGLGAGLALAIQITLSAGGTLDLANGPGRGAIVTLRLPRHVDPTADGWPPRQKASS